MTIEITPYEVRVPDDAIEDLRARIARTRWPDTLGAPWEYGADRAYLEELCRYWAEAFDWRGYKARFNAFPHFLTEIDGQKIHFYHVRSPEPSAKPLIITHGWPGAVTEFFDVIGPLTDPVAFGGDARDAFHVVAPALPGFGYSGPTRESGWGSRRIAAAFRRLMQALGYDTWFAQGGDKGSLVTILMAATYPEQIEAIHLNLLSAPPPDPADPEAGLTDEERDYLARNAAFAAEGSGYQQIHRTRPQTLAFALVESPAGLAAWLVDKFRAWSDCGSDVESAIPRERILDIVSLYWLTGTIGSSIRIYFEDHGPGRAEPVPPVVVPTGHSLFPREIIRSPRAWAEKRYDIRYWRVMPRGGHFPAMEVPDLFVSELRDFFRAYR